MRKREYYSHHTGPYLLVGQTVDENRIKVKKFISELIKKIGASDFIKGIVTPGGKSIKVFVNDRSTANDLSGETLENVKFIIPQSLVECVGVAYLDLDFTDHEIIKAGVGFNRNALMHKPTKILEIRRNVRVQKNNNGESEEIRMNSVFITFEGTSLPTDIDIDNVLFKVFPFIRRPKQCRNCWRFNHIAKFCRQKDPKCVKCGETHEEVIECESKCINCKGNHSANDKKCPKLSEATKKMNEKINSEKNRQELMFQKNREGKAQPIFYTNKDYDSEFPPLAYSTTTNQTNQHLSVPNCSQADPRSRKRSLVEANKDDFLETLNIEKDLTKSPKLDRKNQRNEETIKINFTHPMTKDENSVVVEVNKFQNIINTTGVLIIEGGIAIDFKKKPNLNIYEMAKLGKARLV